MRKSLQNLFGTLTEIRTEEDVLEIGKKYGNIGEQAEIVYQDERAKEDEVKAQTACMDAYQKIFGFGEREDKVD